MANNVRLDIVQPVGQDRLGVLNKIIVFVFKKRSLKILQKVITLFLHVELPILINDLRLPHPFNVVVNPLVTFGNNVTLFHGVTIGGKRTGKKSGCPTIGDNVVFFPNSMAIGQIKIGSNSQIGPGAVVYMDIPPNSIVVGNPGKIVEKQANDE